MSIIKKANPLIQLAAGAALPKKVTTGLVAASQAAGAAAQPIAGKANISAQRKGSAQSINRGGKTVKPPKPPRPPENPEMPKLSHRIHKTYEDMLKMEKRASFGGRFVDGAAFAGAATLGGAAIGGAIYGAGKIHSKMQTEKVWKELQRRRPDLTKTQKDRENFEVVQKFSPDIASNITTLESYMERINAQMMMPHEFVGDLADIQKTRDDKSFSRGLGEYGMKSFGEGMKAASQNRIGGPSGDLSWVGDFKEKRVNSDTKEIDSLSKLKQYVTPPSGRFTKKEIPVDTRGVSKTAQLREELNSLDPRNK